jgi:Peptidase family M28
VGQGRLLTRRGALGGAISATAALGLGRVPAAWAATPADALDPERLHRDVRALCSFGARRTGTKAEARAGAWLAGRLRDAGCDVRVEPYPFRRWRLREWEVRLRGRRRAIASHPVWATRPAAGEAELVYLPGGSPAELDAVDVEGKVVLVDGKLLLNVFATYAVFETYRAVAERGAVAMLGTSDAPGNHVRLLAFGDNRLDANPIPAFTVGREDFAVLREAALAGGARVRYRLDARFADGTTRDVIATLPGQSDETLMACAHFDSMFTGAMDDATGVAALVGLAHHFAARPRPKRMVFLGVAGHDTGFPHLGVRHWVESHPRDVARLAAFCTLDHIAAVELEDTPAGNVGVGLDEERGVFVSDHPALYQVTLEAMAAHRLLPATFLREESIRPNPDLEGLMVDRGVPSVNVTMAYPWYHTVEDTPDKIPAEQLARGTSAYRDILERLQELPAPAIRAGAPASLL